jgi:hypothetical protein
MQAHSLLNRRFFRELTPWRASLSRVLRLVCNSEKDGTHKGLYSGSWKDLFHGQDLHGANRSMIAVSHSNRDQGSGVERVFWRLMRRVSWVQPSVVVPANHLTILT